MLSVWFALPIAAILAGLGLYLVVLRGLQARYRKKQLRLPHGEDVSRPPGRSLLHKIDRVNMELHARRLCVFVQPALCFAIIILYRMFNPKVDLQFLVTAIVACALVFFYCLWNLIRGSRACRRLRLGYDAEVAVGRALDQLRPQGYRVFHDLLEDPFNIDHVLVGPKGVFAVETFARAEPDASSGVEDATVTYNGHVLFFPKWTDEKSVSLAERQAEWLSNWLGSATGEPVSARAMVAVPGWFVRRTTREGIPVVNPKQFPSLFEHIKPRPLSEAQINRIAQQLEQKCREGLDR